MQISLNDVVKSLVWEKMSLRFQKHGRNFEREVSERKFDRKIMQLTEKRIGECILGSDNARRNAQASHSARYTRQRLQQKLANRAENEK